MKIYQIDYIDYNGGYHHLYVVTDKLDKALSIFRKEYCYEVLAINESLERNSEMLIDDECIK